MLKFLFWFSLSGLFYIYFGYPLLVVARARWFPRPVRKGPFRVPVSILISVHGEANKLEKKLRSLLAAEGSDVIREILVGSDGSPDDVAGAILRVGDERIRLFHFQVRRGKPSVLNALMPHASGDIVVLTDARQSINTCALTALLENFADPTVGVVSGELIFRESDSTTSVAKGIDTYWKYEKIIRRAESAFGSVPGATGALYAIRRSLLVPLPPVVLLDDVAVPMWAIRQGFRCVFEPRAEVYDQPSTDVRKEAIRKRRTIAGSAQLVLLWPWLLNPSRNPAFFAFLSHKIARLTSPFLIFITLISSVGLCRVPVYGFSLAAQVVFWGMAALGWVLNRSGLRLGLLGIPLMFSTLNISTLAALWDAAIGRFEVRWARESSDAS